MKKVLISLIGLFLLFSISFPSKCMAKNEVSNTIGIKYTIWDDDYYQNDLGIRIVYFMISFLIVGIPSFLIMKWLENIMGGNTKPVSKVLYIDRLEDVSMDKVYTYLNNENITSLKEKLYLKFVEYKTEFMNFNYAKLQQLCYITYYNEVVNLLNNLMQNHQVDISHSFTRLGSKIGDIHEENNLIVIEFYLQLDYYESLEDDKGNVISGSRLNTIKDCFKIEYVITKKKDDITCLNCGKKVYMEKDGKCPYCGNDVIIEAKDYLIRKVDKITTD